MVGLVDFLDFRGMLLKVKFLKVDIKGENLERSRLRYNNSLNRGNSEGDDTVLKP